MINERTLLTVKEVCALLHISRSTLHRLTSKEVLSVIRVGGSLRYDKEQVMKELRKW